MTVSNQKKQEERNSGFKTAVAAVTGAIVGAGMAVAGAIVLKDKKNQEKVKQVLTNVKDKAMGYMEKMENEEKEKKVVKKVKKIVKLAKDTKQKVKEI